MLDNLNLDHIAINVKNNMDEAYQLFSELGFTLTPRGYHSLGSINHSMVFKNDYLELIGIPRGQSITRPELKKAEIGINGLVFKSDDIKKTYQHLLNMKLSNIPPRNFSRPVEINGIKNEAKFETVSIKDNVFKAGRIYFCDHLTPSLVWIPEYKSHKNNVLGITEITVIDSNPLSVLDKMSKITDKIKIDTHENFITVKTDDVKISLYDTKSFKERYRNFGEEINLRKEMFGSLTLKTDSLTFLKKMKQSNLSNILKYEGKNKVHILLKDYNLILEFIET
tara:strand:- start:1118 stop:1960 length:843 start_codon:yes stop_codon:yes gene_type:complete